MIRKHREERAKELRAMIEDPVTRIVLERKFFEATKSVPPQGDSDLIDAILWQELCEDFFGEVDVWTSDSRTVLSNAE